MQYHRNPVEFNDVQGNGRGHLARAGAPCGRPTRTGRAARGAVNSGRAMAPAITLHVIEFDRIAVILHAVSGNLMLTKAPHLFDDATQVTAGDSRWQGKTSEELLGLCRSVRRGDGSDHPAGADRPSATCRRPAVADGQFLRADHGRRVRSRRPAWSRPTARRSTGVSKLTQDGGEVATLATAVFAERRPSWSHQPVERPQAKSFEQIQPFPRSSRPGPTSMISASPKAIRISAARRRTLSRPAPTSKLWIADRVPRKIDALSLMSMSDAFFGRVFPCQARIDPVRHGVDHDLFHADADDLAAEDITRVLRWPTPKNLPQVLWRPERRICGRPTDGCSQPRRKSRISRRRRFACGLEGATCPKPTQTDPVSRCLASRSRSGLRKPVR